jgi:hypothetical protein
MPRLLCRRFLGLSLLPCQVNGQSYLKIRMSRYCSVFAPHMSRSINSAGHIRDISGTYAGHMRDIPSFSISKTRLFDLRVIALEVPANTGAPGSRIKGTRITSIGRFLMHFGVASRAWFHA